MEINKIYNESNLERLQKIQDNSVDAIITDIPYGLTDIDPLALIKESKNNQSGFMGKKWDVLPTIEMLSEFNRVLKTGGWFATTFTARQDLQAVFLYRLMEAGFDVNFSPIYWTYANGFPKAANYSKVIDKHFGAEREVVEIQKRTGMGFNKVKGFGYVTNDQDNVQKENYNQEITITTSTTHEAKYCDGLYSNSLKPAVEPIIIAQKPYKDAKFKQALNWYYERQELLKQGISEEDLSLYTKNASGGVRIDDCKIPCGTEHFRGLVKAVNNNQSCFHNNIGYHCTDDPNGRFPANLLVSDDCLDVGREWKSSDAIRNNNLVGMFSKEEKQHTASGHKDSGDFSRYFSLDAWTKKHYPALYKVSKSTHTLAEDAEKILPFLNVPKPAVSEKNAGINTKQNTHPTTKPITLFNYLITMFSSENDIILDPFSGSGTTCISAVLTNRKYIGMDITEEYCKIAEARIKYWADLKSKKEDVHIPTQPQENGLFSLLEAQNNHKLTEQS